MPARAQAAGIVMVILFTGFFGAATGHVRLRCDLRLGRLTLLPISRFVLWLDLVLASALTRLLPVVVVLAGFVAINGRGATPAVLTSIFGLLLSSLILVTLLGMATGQLARSNGEVHLFGALVCGLLAFVSGVVPIPERLTWLATSAAWNPIARLLAALTRLSGEVSSESGAEFVLASLFLAAIGATAAFRWISGGAREKSGKT
jgi:hypothetical protein